jgi:mRNA-degrading endonuclease RelE of RelBE toxin-antitoxin system
MSKKDDVFTDNPELWTTGSFKEIATIIEQEWWEEKNKQLSKLSGSIDTELIEFLPEDLRRKLLGREISPEEFDEELPDDSFLWQTFKRNKGKGFEVRCSNKIRRDCKKLTPKEKEETIEILYSLSSEPSGSSLDRPNNVKMMNKQGKRTLEKTFGVSSRSGSSTIFYQYKCGQSLRKRLIWTIEENLNRVVLLFYGERARMNKIWR